MAERKCPHCGEWLPPVADAFCVACREPLSLDGDIENQSVTEKKIDSNRIASRDVSSQAAKFYREKKHDVGGRNDKLIVLATFDNSVDAHLLVNQLRDRGIDATVSNELSSAFGVTIVGPSSAFWLEVLIKESDAQAALAIKEEFIDSISKEKSDIPEWTCSCGEVVDAGFEVCWNCGAEFSR